jgi:exopolysaccharide biosynthesis WecB/TagA/CpsF family protein
MILAGTSNRILLGGAVVDLKSSYEVVTAVREKFRDSRPRVRPLAIASANLDHVHHFGTGGASRPDLDVTDPALDWLVLLDGVPLVRRAANLTGRSWPQLAGSDLLPALLEAAQATGARTGFLGGTRSMHQRLAGVLAQRYPALSVAGLWAPERGELVGDTGAALAVAIRAAGVDLLVVGLGKPRQERWIQRYATVSGARVLLGFGAAADFLAGTAERAPAWVRQAGGEWVYRLAHEPGRLARRYCVHGPPAMWRLWRDSGLDAGPARPPWRSPR